MINVAHTSWNRWKLSQNLAQFLNVAIKGSAPQAWTGHGLEGELLAYFAQSRPKAILLHLVILLPILALNLLNPDGVAIPTGAFLIGLSLFASLFLSERWTRYSLTTSQSIFLVCEGAAGLGWALVAGQSPAPQTIPDFAFFLFIPVALGGTTLAFSAGIELATPALLLPILGMECFELLFGHGPIPPQSIALTLLLTGFFLYLGYRVAEKSTIGKRVMTFSASPTWVNLDGCNDFVSAVDEIRKANWGMNTSFHAALDLILDACVQQKLEPEVVAKMVLAIFSDMQIDEARGGHIGSLYEVMEQKYADAGIRAVGKPYTPPHILFWNLRSTNGFPTMTTQKNVSMMSGFSPVLLNLFCEKGLDAFLSCTPWSILVESLNNPRYLRLEHEAVQII